MAEARVGERKREREKTSALARVNGILRATRGEGKGRFTKLTPAEASELVKKYNRYFRTGVSTFPPYLFSLSLSLSLLSFVCRLRSHWVTLLFPRNAHTHAYTHRQTNSLSLHHHQQWRRRLICFTRVSRSLIFFIRSRLARFPRPLLAYVYIVCSRLDVSRATFSTWKFADETFAMTNNRGVTYSQALRDHHHLLLPIFPTMHDETCNFSSHAIRIAPLFPRCFAKIPCPARVVYRVNIRTDRFARHYSNARHQLTSTSFSSKIAIFSQF
mgnify:CR=1 FL=1